MRLVYSLTSYNESIADVTTNKQTISVEESGSTSGRLMAHEHKEISNYYHVNARNGICLAGEPFTNFVGNSPQTLPDIATAKTPLFR
jgi:hypothetical protein